MPRITGKRHLQHIPAVGESVAETWHAPRHICVKYTDYIPALPPRQPKEAVFWPVPKGISLEPPGREFLKRPSSEFNPSRLRRSSLTVSGDPTSSGEPATKRKRCHIVPPIVEVIDSSDDDDTHGESVSQVDI